MAKFLTSALIAMGLLLVGPQIQTSEANSWRRGRHYYNHYRGYNRGYNYRYRYNYSPRYYRGYNYYRGGSPYRNYYRGYSRPGIGFYYSF